MVYKQQNYVRLVGCDIGWMGYSVLFANTGTFLALKILPGHENTDSCLISTISFKPDSFTLIYSGSKFNNKILS